MKFKVKFKSLSGDISILEVNAADRIDNVKRDLSKIVKIKHENVGFLFKNQFLFNDKIVSDYQIGTEEIVVYFEYENCARYSISDSVDDRLKELNIDQGNDEMIKVLVKDIHSSRVNEFYLSARSKVSHLKRMFADRAKIVDINLIQLHFQGAILSDERTLVDYGIEDGDTVLAIGKLLSGPYYPNLSILPINNGYDKLELYSVSNIDQIIDKIYDIYKIIIDKINIRLYRNADRTGSIINIGDLPDNNICDSVYYDIDHENADRTGSIINIGDLPDNNICDSVYYDIDHEIHQYKICNKLNVDSFGISFRCQEKLSNKVYVLKQFKISIENDDKRNFEKHLACFLSLENHARIVELIKQFNDIDSSYLLMEYIDQGSIGSIIMKNGALSETESAKYAQQILEGLEYLHIHRIIHGNINDSNILIDTNGNVKLSDFGLRTIFPNISNRNSINELLQSEIDAINWLSPELIRNGRLVPASDIWSFGAVMVEMITGRIPHYGLSVAQIVFSIMKGQIKFTFPQFYKDHIKSFISICLKLQPRERANFDDLYQHSFLK